MKIKPLAVRYTTPSGIAVLVSGMLLLAVLFVFLIWHLYHGERERALLNWQVVLGLVAEERGKAVDGWFEERFASLTTLSEDVSLKLYLSDMEEQKETAAPEYLRILLEFTASHGGFAPANRPQSAANESPRPKTAGIAIFDNSKKMVASTEFLPPLTDKLQAFVLQSYGTKRPQFLDIFTAADNNAPKQKMVAFLVPIQGVQDEAIIGYILGVSEVGADLFARLLPVALPYKDAETLLLRKNENRIEYISPLANPNQDGLKLDSNTQELDAAYLLERGGGFAEKTNYQKAAVLAYATPLDSAPWFVMHTVQSESALKESNARAQMLVMVLVLITLLGLATLFAVWRHASSLRAERSAREYREMATSHANQERLLRLITDNQLSSMFILDAQGIIRFANAVMGKAIAMEPSQMIGKRIIDVFGAAQAEVYLEHNQHTLQTMQTESYMHRRKQHNNVTILNIDHIPLAEIPDPYSQEIRKGTLVVENDISATMKEKERRERTLQNLVKTLTSVMDRCIPYFTNHSERVSRLSGIIAIEMGIARNLVRTVQFAGKLMNLGRIFLDKELFTKEGKLTPEELHQIQESVQVSARLIESIEFNGPLAETIRQSGEKMDGTGFLKLQKEEIIVPARILAVANTFIGMVSDRSFRKGMKPEEALDILTKEAGTKYDSAVVFALGHYIANRSDELDWLTAEAA